MSILLPRLYQDEAMKAAAERNIICRMDTGTGKTLVAVMLIRHITSLPVDRQGHSLVVFIVPTVSLVDQVSATLRTQTALRISSFIGSQGVDYWKREQWQLQLESADVVVMTAAIYLNILNNAYYDLEQVSLIVFDEAHHATKKHPYSLIMKDHYRTKPPGSRLPRILGLTASPVFNPKHPAKSISELEANLDARIFEVSGQHHEALSHAAPKPSEQLIKFEANPVVEPTVLETKFLEMYEVRLDPKVSAKIDVTRDRLGSLGVAHYVCQLAKDLSAPQHFQQELLDLLSSMSIGNGSVSPQVRALLDLLESYHDRVDSAFHAIVFVQQRAHAKILTEIVRKVGRLQGWLKADWLVGHGGRGGPEAEKDLGMEVKRQQDVLAAFRNGELNLIFATQVAEEGLDVRACNIVVRFDGLQTITGYIQSRGRARAASSDYIVFAERGSREAQVYRGYLEQEPILREMYATRPAEDPLDEPELDNTPTYTVPSTGALLTYQSAIPLLSQFCALLGTDNFSQQQKPIYTVIPSEDSGLSWACQLRTPMIAALGGVKEFQSPAMATKKGAKQAVAYEACLELHRKGSIDDWMLPVRESRTQGAKDADGREVDASDVSKLGVATAFRSAFGNVWAIEEQEVYLNVLELRQGGEEQRVGLVCGTNLAEATGAEVGSLFEGVSTIDVQIKSSKRIVWPTSQDRFDRLQQLQALNAAVARTSINRRLDTDAPHVALWAPLSDSEATVDWSVVENPFSPADPSTLKEGELIVLPWRRPSVRLGKLLRIREDVDSLSPTDVIETSLRPISSRRKLVSRYPVYHIYCKPPERPFQPSSTPVSTVLRRCLSSQAPHLPSQHVQHHQDRRALLEHCPKIPSLNRLIDEMVQVRRLKERFAFPAIDSIKLREALTPPSAGTGYDYQYLETVGDSVLKLATSIHTFLNYPDVDEGRLSVIRQNSVDNRFLRHRSVDSGFSSFILAQRFRTNTWTPLDEDARPTDDATTLERTVGRRALADTIEATLGAAFATAGLEMALVTGTKLDLCFGGTMPWGQREAAKELLKSPTSEVPPSLKELERGLGYQFRGHGDLLLQAVTHRSYSAATTYCYERFEYLGDALLDFWATKRIFALFPNSTPRHLSFLRALLVSNATLAFLAVRVLRLHQIILHSSPLLELAMMDTATQAEGFAWEAIVSGDMTWMWDPPKALGDCFEAALGAVFVDAGCELDAVLAVLDKAYGEVMPLLSQAELRDPYSRFMMLVDSIHCKQLRISNVRANETSLYVATCTFHSDMIATHSNKTKAVARQLTARLALAFLRDGEGKTLVASCTCAAEAKAAEEEKKATEEAAMEEDAPEGATGSSAETSAEGEAPATNGKRPLSEEEEELDDENGDDSPSSAQRVRVY
ncbi:hypothetical protein BCR35DRAFT_349581 [Leucosporidium creatinivorum]|uniref:Dicer-like protein 1 n=1 Tax=Leucosporidium creatinivorum TaxID=106004 RepID=A0A1Y2G142_9BASI|nr:hypothetical protein BCR35DRAFT_349581 [Leucosporidium creatinivorum]